jgi:hypothetical protein
MSLVKPIAEQVLLDPVLSARPLPLRARFYPLGFPLDLETNSADVMQAASAGWGSFAPAFDEMPMHISLGVAPGESREIPPQSKFFSREHLMSITADTENFVVLDFKQRYAFGWVTPAVAANHPVLRYRFLSTAMLTMVGQLALAPLHCALVARNGCGVALFGDSFAGKSTLAYACARVGWTFLSDDGTHLVRKSSDRYAIGDPYAMHFREDAKFLFPELADRLVAARPNGKIGIEVLTHELPIKIAPGCSIEHIVFLNRNESGAARLQRFSTDDAMTWCDHYVAYGTAEVRAAQLGCYQRLLGASIWELRYTDLDDAIARLEQLVDSGA